MDFVKKLKEQPVPGGYTVHDEFFQTPPMLMQASPLMHEATFMEAPKKVFDLGKAYTSAEMQAMLHEDGEPGFVIKVPNVTAASLKKLKDAIKQSMSCIKIVTEAQPAPISIDQAVQALKKHGIYLLKWEQSHNPSEIQKATLVVEGYAGNGHVDDPSVLNAFHQAWATVTKLKDGN